MGRPRPRTLLGHLVGVAQGPARPKRHGRFIARYASGIATPIEDPDLRIALFLHEHPGWSLHDLETTDPDIVETMRLLARAEAEAAKARQQAQNIVR